MSTPSEIARYSVTDRAFPWIEGEYVLYTDHLAARAADAKEIERLRDELKHRDEYDERVPDPREHKYFNPDCSSGCKFLALTAGITAKAEAAAKEISRNVGGHASYIAEIITREFTQEARP